jgi:hypothetical protein
MTEGIKSLQAILDQLYRDMLPLCSSLIGVARGMGGLAALLYICSRIWKHIAAAEAVDVYGLLRPFGIGLCILLFPSLIALINGVLQPTVTGTAAMVQDSNEAIQRHLSLGNDSTLGMEALNPANWIRELLREFLEIVFQAAGLCINTIRTFYLIVLAIVGPLVLALSIFDGFQHTITVWLARYINVFLWLPVSNIFGAMIAKIQENMIMSGTAVSPLGVASISDTVYMVFMVIAIIGYFTVPSVANYIVNAGGGNALVHKVTSFVQSTGKATTAAMTGGGSMAADSFGDAASRVRNSAADNGVSNGYFKK